MMKRLFFRLSLLSVLFLGSAFAAGPWVSLSGGVAGQDVPVRISGLLEQENVALLLVRPDESKISLHAVADDLGVASTHVNGLHVRIAGEYELLIRREFSDYVVAENFLISPASVSAYRSTSSADISSVAADGEQVSRIRVQIKDAHGNLISGVPVRAFSSRAEDLLVVSPQTNIHGEAVMKVSSHTPGVSSISILAGNVLLFERTELVFHLAITGTKAMGASDGIWNSLGQGVASIFEDPEEDTPVAYFSIEDIGAEVVAGQNLTVRVGAKDANGDVVMNYTGVVRFSSSDDRAVLPNDYTFVAEDQGWHTFYLSVMLQTPGMQTVAVHDLEDFRISGERNVTVSDGGGVVPLPDDQITVSIDIPINGATFSTSRITISGTATGCSLVQLKDGQIELIAELPVDASGTYVYQTPGLADGMHLFQATCVDDPTKVSELVQITIDRSPPQVMSAEFLPAGPILPGTEVILKVGASDDLSAVSCTMYGQIYNLASEDSKNFSGTLRAPATPGEYPVGCTLADLLGNKMTEPNAGVVVVDASLGMSMELIPSGAVAPLAKSTVRVSSINDLVSVNCVYLEQPFALVMQDALNFSGQITAPAEEGEYPATCTGLDTEGNQSTDTDSLIVALGGAGANIAPLPVSNVQARAEDDRITFFWSPAIDDGGIKNYRINYVPHRKEGSLGEGALSGEGGELGEGALSGEGLSQVNMVPGTRTQWYIDELEKGVLYDFQIIPINGEGIEGPGSEVITMSTLVEMEEVDHPAPPKTGGTTSWWFAIFSIIAGLGVVIILRRRA